MAAQPLARVPLQVRFVRSRNYSSASAMCYECHLTARLLRRSVRGKCLFTFDEMEFAIEDTGFLSGIGSIRSFDEGARFIQIIHSKDKKHIIGFFQAASER